MIKSIGFYKFGLVIIPKFKTFQTAKKPNQMKKSILVFFLYSIIAILIVTPTLAISIKVPLKDEKLKGNISLVTDYMYLAKENFGKPQKVIFLVRMNTD